MVNFGYLRSYVIKWLNTNNWLILVMRGPKGFIGFHTNTISEEW